MSNNGNFPPPLQEPLKGDNSDDNSPRAAANVFDDLEALRLSPEDAATVGTREILSRVPVRKPLRTEFFRVHPDADMQLATGVFIDREEGETYFVTPELRSAMSGEWRPVMLVTVITKQNVVLLWPIALPDETGRRNDWAESARAACEEAKSHWVRLVPDMALRAYRIYVAEGKLAEPVWPDKSLAELLALGFKDYIIDSVDHPVIGRLRGVV
jgi:hypothetical protein